MARIIYGNTELAELIGVKPATIRSYLSRKQIPKPWVTLACGPIWRDYDIRGWLNERENRAHDRREAAYVAEAWERMTRLHEEVTGGREVKE